MRVDSSSFWTNEKFEFLETDQLEAGKKSSQTSILVYIEYAYL